MQNKADGDKHQLKSEVPIYHPERKSIHLYTEQVPDRPALLNQPTPVSLASSQLIMPLIQSPIQSQLHSTSVLISSSHILSCHHSCSLIPLCYIHLPMPTLHLHVRNPLQQKRFSFFCCPTLFCQTSAKKRKNSPLQNLLLVILSIKNTLSKAPVLLNFGINCI